MSKSEGYLVLLCMSKVCSLTDAEEPWKATGVCAVSPPGHERNKIGGELFRTLEH